MMYPGGGQHVCKEYYRKNKKNIFQIILVRIIFFLYISLPEQSNVLSNSLLSSFYGKSLLAENKTGLSAPG